MATEQVDPRVAKRVRLVTDVRIIIEPDHLGRWIRQPHGTPQYWTEFAKECQEWVNKFEEFLRDHVSQDDCALSVDKTVINACSVCSNEWETALDDGKRHCAHCGAFVE